MAAPQPSHIPALDALRFIAAFCVLIAHFAQSIFVRAGMNGLWVTTLTELSAIGMQIFFVLSGVVIHLTYRDRLPQETRAFWVARFARLYPLFLALFLVEYAMAVALNISACGADTAGMLHALPYHLTFTQSWFYSTPCNHSLIYQYPPLSGVTWSLSVEFFLYLCYTLFVRRWVSHGTIRRLLAIAGGACGALIGYFLAIYLNQSTIESSAVATFGAVAGTASGYQDSLLRWLLYFNPTLWLVPFLWGAVIAEIHRRGGIVHARAIPVALLATAVLYGGVILHLAPTHPFLGRISGFILMPCLAALIALTLSHPQHWLGRLLAWQPLVRLGEASYSIYLLHPFIAGGFVVLRHASMPPWAIFAIGIALTLAISRVTYRYYERPMQRWLRQVAARG